MMSRFHMQTILTEATSVAEAAPCSLPATSCTEWGRNVFVEALAGRCVR